MYLITADKHFHSLRLSGWHTDYVSMKTSPPLSEWPATPSHQDTAEAGELSPPRCLRYSDVSEVSDVPDPGAPLLRLLLLPRLCLCAGLPYGSLRPSIWIFCKLEAIELPAVLPLKAGL